MPAVGHYTIPVAAALQDAETARRPDRLCARENAHIMRGDTPGHHATVTNAREVSRRSPILAALWVTYLFVLPFHRVWTLPWLGTKLQPPELVFVGLVVCTVLSRWRERIRWRPVACDAAAAAWLVACVASTVTLHGRLRFGDSQVLAEALGGVSLVCLYGAVRLTATPDLMSRVGKWFGVSAAVAATLGLAGVFMAWSGAPTRLATIVMTLVPYVENGPRAQAFTAGPQMLASILLLAVPLFVASRLDDGWRRRDRAVLLLLLLGLVATMSKTALCVVPALAVMWAVGPRRQTDEPIGPARARVWLAAAIWCLVAVVFVAGSHLMLVRDAEVSRWTAGQVVAGAPLASFDWRGGRWLLMPTTYAYNKRASLLAIEASWPRGIGPAQLPAFTARLQQDGRMPASMWMTTPHSTYLGPVAELGAPGLMALTLLLLAGGGAMRRLIGASGLPGWEAAAYAGAGAAFLIEATSTDLMNCRHYWWLLAIVAARAAALRDGLRQLR